MHKLVHDNQERMREGPQLLRGINPRIMQVQQLGAVTLSQRSAVPAKHSSVSQLGCTGQAARHCTFRRSHHPCRCSGTTRSSCRCWCSAQARCQSMMRARSSRLSAVCSSESQCHDGRAADLYITVYLVRCRLPCMGACVRPQTEMLPQLQAAGTSFSRVCFVLLGCAWPAGQSYGCPPTAAKLHTMPRMKDAPAIKCLHVPMHCIVTLNGNNRVLPLLPEIARRRQLCVPQHRAGRKGMTYTPLISDT